MNNKKICLASDNFTPVHPRIMEALFEANVGYAPSYGLDPWTAQAEKLILHSFKESKKALFLPNGTGANVLALKLACKRYESVICTDIAHLHYQESGSAEAIVGCKLLTVPHLNGKITIEGVRKKLKTERAFGKHSTSPRVLSITQPTELGTLYSCEELRALSNLCKEEGLLLHMDGSRLYNAAVAMKRTLSDSAGAGSLDLLSLGGTKNGLMGAEALVIFNSELLEGADHLHKQNLGLLSKMRYLSAQFIPFFEENLWEVLAKQANERAQEIAAIVRTIPKLCISYPVETNQIFFTLPSSWIPLLHEKVLCFAWDQEKNEIRFTTSWNTSEEDVKNLHALFNEIAN